LNYYLLNEEKRVEGFLESFWWTFSQQETNGFVEARFFTRKDTIEKKIGPSAIINLGSK